MKKEYCNPVLEGWEKQEEKLILEAQLVDP